MKKCPIIVETNLDIVYIHQDITVETGLEGKKVIYILYNSPERYVSMCN